MTTALQPKPTDHPPQLPAQRRGPPPTEDLLAVTAHSVPPGAVALAVRGEIDMHTSPLLRDQLFAHLCRPATLVVIDLSEVEFFGAAGLTVLIAVSEAARTAGIGLCLVVRGRVVPRVLAATGLTGAFDLHPDAAHALLHAVRAPART